MTPPPYIQLRADGILISLKVQPRASKNEIGKAIGGDLKIKVTAAPVDSAANEAILRLLAETLDCPRGAVQLLRGQTSRRKQVLVRGLSAMEVTKRLTK
jgi:uncharacterized protein